MTDSLERVLALGTPDQIAALEHEIAFELQTRKAAEANRIWKAMMLAPTAQICEALLRGEHVPIGRLDPEWAERFGLRKNAA